MSHFDNIEFKTCVQIMGTLRADSEYNETRSGRLGSILSLFKLNRRNGLLSEIIVEVIINLFLKNHKTKAAKDSTGFED